MVTNPFNNSQLVYKKIFSSNVSYLVDTNYVLNRNLSPDITIFNPSFCAEGLTISDRVTPKNPLPVRCRFVTRLCADLNAPINDYQFFEIQILQETQPNTFEILARFSPTEKAYSFQKMPNDTITTNFSIDMDFVFVWGNDLFLRQTNRLGSTLSFNNSLIAKSSLTMITI